ncbi:MAG: diaminobutyrate--2-oxoglutarate transaminase [Chloroflexota bacterium]
MIKTKELESNVRSYCRSFPKVFAKAKNATIHADDGTSYIDFFAGAGALNYGHNNDYIKGKLIEYIESDAISHGLDLFTTAKNSFMQTFEERVLAPKGLDYRIQFPGPTGTNAVEAAIKLARKVKQRPGIFTFMGGFHGMTLGSLSLTGNKYQRGGAGFALQNHVTFMPHPSMTEKTGIDSLAYIESVISDSHSGIEKPAAIIYETVQAEGGINVAPVEWMQQLQELCTAHDILMIVDDIQAGCGRSGNFFSFERANLYPDLVTVSKSISGYGLPMSLVLMKPELDEWGPGEHNGTFRGNQHAFVCGEAALEYRDQVNLPAEVAKKEKFICDYMANEILPLNGQLKVRGIGMIWGIDFSALEEEGLADQVSAKCFENGLIIETAGRKGDVVKLLSPLTIEMDLLQKGCEIIKAAVIETL